MQLFDATSEPATDGVALAKPSRLIPECSVLMGFMYDLAGTVSDARGCGLFGDSSTCERCKPALFALFAAAFTTLSSAYAPRDTLRNRAS